MNLLWEIQDLRKKFNKLVGNATITNTSITNIISSDTSNSGSIVKGPASVTNLRIAVFDGATGKVIKDGGKTIAQLSESSGGISKATAIAYAVAL